MFVRVFDKANHRYYKSMVYCGINYGYYQQYVVVNPYTDCFELVDYLDKSDGGLRALVETIQAERDDWVGHENVLLQKCKAYCQKHSKEIKLDLLVGYRDVCENIAFLTAILKRKSVPVSEAGISLRSLPDSGVWNYIQTQADVDAFLEAFAGFHDSTLDKLIYEESDDNTKVTATFDNSSWYGIVELCFEGVLAINIRPSGENYSREIMEATLLIQDETVFWADQYMEQEDLSYDGSFIKALNLKWRKIG